MPIIQGLSTKHIVSNDGERLKILVEQATGVPLFYPNLYITSQIRGGCKSIATIQSFITSMKVLNCWSAKYSIDIERRWKCGDWFQIWEVDSLRDFCSRVLRDSSIEFSKVTNIKKQIRSAERKVDSPTKYARMTFVADYVKWLSYVMGAAKYDKKHKIDVETVNKHVKLTHFGG